MSKAGNRHKSEQLGMPHGTAANKLRKMLMFEMAQCLELDTCFRCGKKIETTKELSVEHKQGWLNTKDPIGLFFDLDNVAFSHLGCNNKAPKNCIPSKIKHGTFWGYHRGCRCADCKKAKQQANIKYRGRK